jgi:hypothetical protein
VRKGSELERGVLEILQAEVRLLQLQRSSGATPNEAGRARASLGVVKRIRRLARRFF